MPFPLCYHHSLFTFFSFTISFFKMKHLFILLVALVTFQLSMAQSLTSSTGICSYLQVTGRVQLLQDGRLTDLLGTHPKTYYAGSTKTNSQGVVIANGYRIRVFSGNQQNTSKNRAYAIQKEMNDQMPDLKTYVVFKTPNWRLLVGNYRTSEEANAMLRELRHQFPAYGKEMFVVKEEIEL